MKGRILRIPFFSAIYLAIGLWKGFGWLELAVGFAIYYGIDMAMARAIPIYGEIIEDGNEQAEKTLKERKQDKRLVS